MQKLDKNNSNIQAIYEHDESDTAKDVRDILKNAFIAFLNSKEILY